MLLVGFETTISAGEQLQTYALDHPDTGTGSSLLKGKIKRLIISCTIFWSYVVECQLEVILINDGSHYLPYFLQSNVGMAVKRVKHL
jgi:hypothetical protein